MALNRMVGSVALSKPNPPAFDKRVELDVFEAIEGRRSIRVFRPDPIPDNMLKKMLEAAQWAPSAGNLQAREFIIVKDPEIKRALCDAALGQTFIIQAPVNIVVCANKRKSAMRYGRRGEELYCILDAAAAVQNLMLAACALGLGTCWIGAFYDDEVSKILDLPNWLRPVAIIPTGYPAESPLPPPREPLSEVAHRERYGSK